MAQIIPQLDRLKSQLLTSGLQQKNQPLFQVINQLIDAVRQGVNELNTNITAVSGSGGGGSTSFTTITTGTVFPRDGEDGSDGLQGLPGPQGIPGPMGPMGPAGIDGSSDSWEIPFVGSAILNATSAGVYVQRLP